MTEKTLPSRSQPSFFGNAMTWANLALVLSAAGTIGSLYLSLGLRLKACPLCFYQRTFVMGGLAVLALGLVVERSRPGLLCLLALPLAWAGLGVAAFHEYLVLAGVLECPKALLDLGTAPAQSLGLFLLLAASTMLGTWFGRGESVRQNLLSIAAAAVLGGLLAWGCVASSPPLPPAPAAPYDPVKQPLDMCRPVFRGARPGHILR